LNYRFHTLFGKGIFTSNGSDWKQQRETARPMFKTNSIDEMVPIFVSRTLRVMDVIKANPEQDVQNLAMRYTLDSIGSIGYGVDLGALNMEENKFAQNFENAQLIVEQCNNFFYSLLPTPVFDQNVSFLKDFADRILNERKKTDDYKTKTDLLSRFMQITDEEGKMLDDSILRDILLNFFIAGRDTTGCLLAWTFDLLAQHPEVEAKLLEEINVHFSDIDKEDDEEQISKLFDTKNSNNLKYLHNVLSEVLRLYPPVPVDGRLSVEEDTLPNGFVHAANTPLLYSSWALHRSPKWWDDPLEFKPERFDQPLKHPFQYVPFHGGPQVCLGQNMALREAKIFVALILRKFSFKLADGFKAIPRRMIVLPSKNGVRGIFTLRNAK